MAPSAARRATPSPPIGALLGPTGSGKTELSLALAARLEVEILVADSRQVYRGMEIGTATPDAAARASVPHHLLDLVDVGQPFSVADWIGQKRTIVFGKKSGRASVEFGLEEMGFTPNEPLVAEVLTLVKSEATRLHRALSDDEFTLLAHEVKRADHARPSVEKG